MADRKDPAAALTPEIEGTVPSSWYVAVKQERDRYREALQSIESMTGAAGDGEVPAMPIALRARKALDADA